MKRTGAVVVALLLLVSLGIFAGPLSPEQTKAAKEFLAVSGVAYWYDEDIRYGLEDFLKEEYLKNLPVSKQERGKKLIAEAVAKVRWKSVEDRAAESLARDFSAKELKELIEFFKTPAGQKLAKVPLERRVNAVTKELVKSPMLRLRDQMEKLVKEKE